MKGLIARIALLAKKDHPADDDMVSVVSGAVVSDSILKKAVDFANAAFNIDYAVACYHVKRWIAKNPSVILLLLDQQKNVAGFFSYFQVSAGSYTDLCRGKLCDWDILDEASSSNPQRSFEDDNLYFYIGAIVVREDLRGTIAFPMFKRHIIELLLGKAKDGQRVYVACEIHSPAGERAAIKLGLKAQRMAVDGYPIYAGLLCDTVRIDSLQDT